MQVVERAVALREIGAGIQLSPNGMKIMRALGLEDAVLQRGFLPEALEMRMGRSGFPIFRLPIKSASHYRWRAPYVHIHRADLIDILSQALHQRAPGCVRLGTMVQGLFEDGAGVVCQDGERLSADVVIAADGLRSTLRSAAFGPQPARYTGMTAWRATVPLRLCAGARRRQPLAFGPDPGGTRSAICSQGDRWRTLLGWWKRTSQTQKRWKRGVRSAEQRHRSQRRWRTLPGGIQRSPA